MTTFERIKFLAKKKGYSLQELAEANGLGINSIYKWKKQDPKSKDLAKIAKTLNTTTDYLNGLTDDPLRHENNGLGWSDLGMPYGGKIPDELKGMYKALAEQYVKDHPDSIRDDK